MEKSVSGGPLRPQHAHRKHTQARKHSYTHRAICSQRCRPSTSGTSFGMQPQTGDKSTVFCVSTAIPHIQYQTWPQQACLEVQASKTTHTRARAPLRGFFHMNFLFSLLTLYGFNSLAQTHLNSPEWQLKSFLLCKRQWYLYFQLFQRLVASICYLNVVVYFEFCSLWMARLGSKHLNAETALILVFDMFTKFNILYGKVMGYRQEYGCYTKEIMRWEMYLFI